MVLFGVKCDGHKGGRVEVEGIGGKVV